MSDAPSKEAQIAEASQRVAKDAPAVTAAERESHASAADVAGDDDAGDGGAPPAPRVPAEEAETDIRPNFRSPKDDTRDAISKSFRAHRDELKKEDDDDARILREMASLPEEMREIASGTDPATLTGEEGVVANEDDDAATPRPAKFKVKVNGQERELTYEEMTAAAQKALASDDVLSDAKAAREEARRALEAAERLRTEIQASRTASAPKPGDGQETQPGGTDGAQGGGENHDPMREAIEAIQYGDPDDAKKKFGNIVETTARRIVQESTEQERLNAAKQRADQTVKAFNDDPANKELLADLDAQDAIRGRIYRAQLEDLKSLGIYKEEDLARANNDAIAQEHLRARANGLSVRTPEKMLSEVVAGYREKNKLAAPTTGEGGTATGAAAQPGGKTADTAPRVQIDVNRTARREAIPQQPTRTATPRPTPQPRPQDPVATRASAVEKMRSARMGPRTPPAR